MDLSSIASARSLKGERKENMEKIQTKFTWDTKTVIWEIENISEAIGRIFNMEQDSPATDKTTTSPIPGLPPGQEYRSMLDIDYINCLPFEAGCQPHNKSLWSLSLYKQTIPNEDAHLGLFIHLLEIESDSGVNQRFHHNHSFDDFENHGLYLKYNMNIISSRGTVLHKIENDTIINLMSGNSWGEDRFISLNKLQENSYYVSDDKLRIKVELWLFQQLSHTIKRPEEEDMQLDVQSMIEHSTSDKSSALETQILGSLWNNRDFADATIICGERSFVIHKCIITAASPVFKAMFTNDMTEASKNEVTIIDTDPKVLETMLEFLYTGEISKTWDWTNFTKVAELVDSCEKYQVKRLKELSFEIISDRLSIAIAGDVAVLTHLYNAEEFVKATVQKFIIKNIKVLREQAHFAKLVNEYPVAFASVLLSNEFCKTMSTT